MPGLTRDRREGEAEIAGHKVKIVDTAGLEEANTGTIADRMRKQSETAIATAELVLFFFQCKLQHFYASDYVANVWRDLRSGDVSRETLQKIREAMFALGHDPGGI